MSTLSHEYLLPSLALATLATATPGTAWCACEMVAADVLLWPMTVSATVTVFTVPTRAVPVPVRAACCAWAMRCR